MFDLLLYLKVFMVGGLICMIGQVLIIKTKLTSARILVLFVVLGAILQAIGVYQPLIDFADSGATVPILGFGKSLAEGVMLGLQEDGIIGIFTGGLSRVAGGLTAAVGFAYFFALFFNAKTKKP